MNPNCDIISKIFSPIVAFEPRKRRDMKKTVKKTPQNVVQKIIAAHLVEGDPAKDAELGIRIDQTLTQDATGTMA